MYFPEFERSKDLSFRSTSHVEMSLKHDGQFIMMLASLKVERETLIANLHVVCGFPDVLSDDISDFTLEHEVKFEIDLVPGTRSMSRVSYRMFALELSKLKEHLKELLEKKFGIPNVSP